MQYDHIYWAYCPGIFVVDATLNCLVDQPMEFYLVKTSEDNNFWEIYEDCLKKQHQEKGCKWERLGEMRLAKGANIVFCTCICHLHEHLTF